MSSLSRTGVPGPSPEITAALSTYFGGHSARRIRLAGSVLQLDDALHACRKVMKPVHLAIAANTLAKLSRGSALAPPSVQLHTLHFQRIAKQLEDLSSLRAPRLVAWQIGAIVHGLSESSHSFQQESLGRLAARLVADNCQRIRLAHEHDVLEIVRGFVAQGYTNPVFWHKLVSAVAPRLRSFTPGRVTMLLQHLPLDPASSGLLSGSQRELQPSQGHTQACMELAAAATASLEGRAAELASRLVVDLAQALMKLESNWPKGATGSDATSAGPQQQQQQQQQPFTPALVQELQVLSASDELLASLKPKQVALLVSALGRLYSPLAITAPGADDKAPGGAGAGAAGAEAGEAAAEETGAGSAGAGEGAGLHAAGNSNAGSSRALSAEVCAAVGRWAAAVPLASKSLPSPSPSPRAAAGGLELRHVAGIVHAASAAGCRDAALYTRLAQHADALLASGREVPVVVLSSVAAAFGAPEVHAAPGAAAVARAAAKRAARYGRPSVVAPLLPGSVAGKQARAQATAQ